jgi:hypothetical protein
MKRTIESEFPDFDLATLPAMPEGFEDVSWHNDTCPSFIDEARGLIVFVDYADPSLSEYPNERRNGTAKRFVVCRYDTDMGMTHETLLKTDEWSEVLSLIASHD